VVKCRNKFLRRKLLSKPTYIIVSLLAVLLLIVGIGGISVNCWYNRQLKPLSSKPSKIIVTIPLGSSASQIGKLLAEEGVIKSARAFEWYVRSHDLRDSLKAGQYVLSASQSTPEVVLYITEGRIKKDLFTIIPGKRLDQIRQSMIDYGFDKNEVDKALDAANYKNHPALIAKPGNASLEGYLFPESLQTTSNTKPQDIIEKSLDQMFKALTPDLINAFQKRGLGIHQGVILASVIEKEVSHFTDKKMVAGVFYNRLKINMPLAADATYQYASFLAGQPNNPKIDSPYNTYKYPGLPVGPISNVSKESLLAVAYPLPNDYLFYVTGDDGKTYFSKTIEEHESLAEEHCKKRCSTY